MELTVKMLEEFLSNWGCPTSVELLDAEGEVVKALVFRDDFFYRVSVNPILTRTPTEDQCSGALYSKSGEKFHVINWVYKDTKEEAMVTLFSMLAQVKNETNQEDN